MQKIITILTVVTLLLITGNIAQATTIFSDGFESGSLPGAWTGTTIDSGQSLTLQSSGIHHGTYAAFADVDLSQAGTDAKTYKSLTLPSTYYVRGYFKITNFVQASSYARTTLLEDNQLDVGFALRVNTNPPQIYLWYRSGTVLNGVNLTTTFPLNVWNCIEMKRSNTDDDARWWLNGTEIYSVTGLTDWVYVPSQILAGANQDSTGVTGSLDIYYDCVVISDAYIGSDSTATIRNALIKNAQIK